MSSAPLRRVIAGATRGIAGTRGFHDLAGDGTGIARVFGEEFRQFLGDDALIAVLTSDDTSLSLVCDENFGSGT